MEVPMIEARRREREAAGRVLWVISYVKMKADPDRLGTGTWERVSQTLSPRSNKEK